MGVKKPTNKELESLYETISKLPMVYEDLSQARWIAWRLRRMIGELPVGLDELDPELAEYIYSDSDASEWLDGPEGDTRFGWEGPKK